MRAARALPALALAGALVTAVLLLLPADGPQGWPSDPDDPGTPAQPAPPATTLAPPVAAEPAPIRPAAVAAGRVLDALTGAPIAAASWNALGPDGPCASTSDATGTVWLDAAPADLAELRVEAAGHLPLHWRAAGELPSRSWAASTRCLLLPVLRLEVMVVDPLGVPVAGALVGVRLVEAPRTIAAGAEDLVGGLGLETERFVSRTSDPRGLAEFPELPRGAIVQLDVQGRFRPVSRRVSLEAATAEQRCTVVVEPGVTLLGTVRHPDGTAAAGLSVQVRTGRVGSVLGRTQADGRFRIDGLVPGAGEIRLPAALATGHPVRLEPPLTDVGVLEVPRPMRLQATVTSCLGAGGSACFLSLHAGLDTVAGVHVPAGGRVAVDVPGTTDSYTIQLYDGGTGRVVSGGPLDLHVTALELPIRTGVCGLELRPRGTAGWPDAEVEVSLFPLEPASRAPQWPSGSLRDVRLPEVGEDGGLRVAPILAGTWGVVVTAGARQGAWIPAVELSDCTWQQVEVEFGSGAAVIRAGRGAAPAAGARLAVESPAFGVRRAVADEHGRASFEDLPPGPWLASVDTPIRFAEGSAAFTVQVGMTTQVELDVAPTGSLAIRARRAGGPAQGCEVRLHPAPDAPVASSPQQKTTTTTDADGSARFDDLAAGRYGVTLQEHGQPSAPFTVVLADVTAGSKTEVELLLPDTTTLGLCWQGRDLPDATDVLLVVPSSRIRYSLGRAEDGRWLVPLDVDGAWLSVTTVGAALLRGPAGGNHAWLLPLPATRDLPDCFDLAEAGVTLALTAATPVLRDAQLHITHVAGVVPCSLPSFLAVPRLAEGLVRFEGLPPGGTGTLTWIDAGGQARSREIRLPSSGSLPIAP